MSVTSVKLSIYRGDAGGGEMVTYHVPVREGMVVLDAVLWVQANLAADLAVRWNCKAAKCGSCSAEINGFPRLMVRIASLEMHPKDTLDRRELLRREAGVGMCNVTKCCTEVCPEHIHITDNAIIPLKERVVDRHYDPVLWLWRRLTGGP